MIITLMIVDQGMNCIVVNMRLFHSSVNWILLARIRDDCLVIYPPEATRAI